MHKEINFSPYANNVLDFIGRTNLVTPKGIPASIARNGNGFKILIGDQEFITQNNWEASFVLNAGQVGING